GLGAYLVGPSAFGSRRTGHGGSSPSPAAGRGPAASSTPVATEKPAPPEPRRIRGDRTFTNGSRSLSRNLAQPSRWSRHSAWTTEPIPTAKARHVTLPRGGT